MEVPLSYLSLHRVVKLMRRLGLYPIDPGSSKVHRFWHKIYRRVVLSLVAVYIIQEIFKIYDVRKDADKIIANTFVFLTYTGYIYKLIAIEIKSKQIDQVLDMTKGPVFNQEEPEHREPLLKAINFAVTFGPIFNYMAVAVWIFMHLHVIISHLQGKLVEFPIWLPFDHNLDLQFYLAVFYSWIITTATAFGNTICDILIVFLLKQCKTQISILRLDIERVVKKSNDEQIKTRKGFNDIFERRMKNIIVHHNEIVRMAVKLDDIFGAVLLYQFFIGGWIMCMLAYNITNVNVAFAEFMSLLVFMITVLTEQFLYCYYGNDVTLESEMLSRSFYEMDWLSLSVKHRRSLLIFMERCKQPIKPMAGKIIALSNTTFIAVLRSSYSFYAFLNNSQNHA